MIPVIGDIPIYCLILNYININRHVCQQILELFKNWPPFLFKYLIFPIPSCYSDNVLFLF